MEHTEIESETSFSPHLLHTSFRDKFHLPTSATFKLNLKGPDK